MVGRYEILNFFFAILMLILNLINSLAMPVLTQSTVIDIVFGLPYFIED